MNAAVLMVAAWPQNMEALRIGRVAMLLYERTSLGKVIVEQRLLVHQSLRLNFQLGRGGPDRPLTVGYLYGFRFLTRHDELLPTEALIIVLLI